MRLVIQPNTYYVWLGGSCDYGRQERFGGGAYLLEHDGMAQDPYVIADLNTTEFRMLLQLMIHALQSLPPQSRICFLSNVAYLQNFNRTPTEKTANADLITQCIALSRRHAEVAHQLISYYKYPHLPLTHELAHNAMLQLRKSYSSRNK